MSEWQVKTLAEMCETITVGHVGSMASQYVESGIPFLRSQNVRPGRLDMGGLKFISEEFHQQLRKSRLRAGDVVIVRTGQPGAAALIPSDVGELNCSDLVIVRPANSVDPRFLCYSINATSGHYVAAHLVGAVQQHFNVGSARNLRVYAPPLPQQRAIADVLAALDDKISVNDRIAYVARHLGLSAFASALESRPQEHEIDSLAELVTRGVTPRYSDNESDLLVLNQKCIRDGRVSFGPARRTARDKVRSEKLLRAHDVVVNSTGVGTLGRVAMWNSVQDCTVDTHVTIVRFDVTKADPLCAGFGMLLAQPQIEVMGEGSTGQTELSRTKLAAMRLTLPVPEAMQALRPSLEALEARAEKALVESYSLARLRDALLPKLMSGEIRVRDAEKAVEDAT